MARPDEIGAAFLLGVMKGLELSLKLHPPAKEPSQKRQRNLPKPKAVKRHVHRLPYTREPIETDLPQPRTQPYESTPAPKAPEQPAPPKRTQPSPALIGVRPLTAPPRPPAPELGPPRPPGQSLAPPRVVRPADKVDPFDDAARRRWLDEQLRKAGRSTKAEAEWERKSRRAARELDSAEVSHHEA